MGRPAKYSPWTFVIGISLVVLLAVLDSCGLINMTS